MNRMIGVVVAILVIVGIVYYTSNKPQKANTVVCYTALDMEFSKPILEKFKAKTGIDVKWQFDAESTKTVGLTNQIINEKDRPRCDVFWNNEVVQTIRLKQMGLLQEYHPTAAKQFPNEFKDPDGMWTGFAARARVLIINTELVKKKEMPSKLADLYTPKWKGKIGIANPLAGSTSTWIAVFFQHKKAGDPEGAQLDLIEKMANEGYFVVLDGNKATAQNVSAGKLAMAFTDTDDAIIEKETGKPVEFVYPDGGKDGFGNLFFPNTLSMVKGCPNPENAKKLIEFLLSPEVEEALAKSESAQIPVNPAIAMKPRVATPKTVKPLPANWDKVAEIYKDSEMWIKKTFKE